MFWFNRDSRRQFKAIFQWLGGVVLEKEFILLETLNSSKIYYFKFPLKYGDKPKRLLRGKSKAGKPSFIVRLHSLKRELPKGDWVPIFRLPEIEIWESKERPLNVRPLRFGLSKEEKRKCLELARDTVSKFLEGEGIVYQKANLISSRFLLDSNVDVSFWLDGELRGSAVVENIPLGLGIMRGALTAVRDFRFKPLTKADLRGLRIEISIFNNLYIPLSERIFEENIVFNDRGYLFRRGDENFWLLPSVLNLRRIRNFSHFLEILVKDKAGDNRVSYKDSINIFQVESFIESEGRRFSLVLRGPVVEITPLVSSSDLALVTGYFYRSADWLLRNQDSDGFLPQFINPLNLRKGGLDWARLAFVGWSLAEFGRNTKNDKYIKAGEKILNSGQKTLSVFGPSKITDYDLTLSYLGKLSFILEKYGEAVRFGYLLIDRIKSLPFEPIIFAHIAGLFDKLSLFDGRFGGAFEYLANILNYNFDNSLKRENVYLVQWAELASVFMNEDPTLSERVFTEIKEGELVDVDYFNGYLSNKVNTRGVGKLFEVLALRPLSNKDSIDLLLPWLVKMQYNEENTFFVSGENRHLFTGGFRHDYFNHEAWIDAAGHFILAGSRMISNSKQ